MSTASGTAASKKAAARARKNEAATESEQIRFEHDGTTYTVDSDAGDDLLLVEALEDERYVTAIRKLLGPEQWATYSKSAVNAKGRLPADVAGPFLDKLLGVIGQGNSSASSTS